MHYLFESKSFVSQLKVLRVNAKIIGVSTNFLRKCKKKKKKFFFHCSKIPPITMSPVLYFCKGMQMFFK